MSNVIRAELLKVVSVRALRLLPLWLVANTLLGLAGLHATLETGRTLSRDAMVSLVEGPGFTVGLTMLILGILVTAGEFGHGTITSTLVVNPRRRRLVGGKAAVVALIAASTAVAVKLLSLGLGVAWLRSHDVTITISAGEVLSSMAALVTVAVLYGVGGVGLGLLVRNQTAAVGAALGWVVAEGIVPFLVGRPKLLKWLPVSAANAVLGKSNPIFGLLVSPWVGALFLAAVAGALAVVGTARFTRADA